MWLFSHSVVSDSLDPMDCSSPGSPVLHYLLEFAQIHVRWVGDAIQPSHPLLPLLLLSSILPSIRVFSNELALCIRWPKYWSFSFSISPTKEYSQLISFRMDWFILSLVSVQNRICVGGMLGPCCFPRHPSPQEMRHRCCLLQMSKHTWRFQNSSCPLDPLTCIRAGCQRPYSEHTPTYHTLFLPILCL